MKKEEVRIARRNWLLERVREEVRIVGYFTGHFIKKTLL